MGGTQLKKEVSALTALTVVIGTVIGAGIFFKPTAVYGAAGSPGLGLLAWVLGGIIAIAGGLTVAEIGTIFPETGGMMIYLEKVFGKWLGFLVGWAQMIVYFPANIAALAIIFATQVTSLFDLSMGYLIPIAICVASLVMGMNLLGTKYGGFVQNVSTLLKLIPIAVIIIAGLLYPGGGVVRLLPMSVTDHPFVTSLGSALVATVFAYDGWMNVGALAGEMKNPGKVLPKVIIGGLSIVMSVYLLINIAYLFVLDAPQLAATDTPAAAVAQALFGGFGGKLVTIGILISVFGGINGYTISGLRIPYALGSQNLLPFSNWFSKLSKSGNMPTNGGILMLVISIVMICSGQFNQLTDLIVFVIWIFNTLTFVAVIKLRRTNPELVRPYKVPFYPVVPLIAILGGFYIILNTLYVQPLNAGLGLLLTLLGIPVYLYQQNKIKKR
ncbi:amino acid permease [Carnobacterium divergens]|uniref:APC family permease n=1 Tax=Carnobacterium divergens TaxID=2748 RepID=UPI0010722C5A|nr:amino acid permease [Carnobacterium divergens]MDT1995417.1 amino acid permease [Carnobacterium divergens]TFI62181.1 amino acid permease [Carnobacterium divergens]TFI62279.1 amino acid permease [Carnobacterium divergens]TFI66320.1 amino acid permease [Carnobacterium divergens]TFI77742.1 amino acid permease [Carnobacterium divergens]